MNIGDWIMDIHELIIDIHIWIMDIHITMNNWWIDSLDRRMDID